MPSCTGKVKASLVPTCRMQDVVIVGGGVIGMTAALELAHRGYAVTVFDQQQIGQEASWAGAGMLPPGQITGPASIRQLAKLSASMWPELSRQLYESTGIDNGYRQSGSINVSLANESELPGCVEQWRAESVSVEVLHSPELHDQFSFLTKQCCYCFHLPEMSQVRNPRHLQALKQACVQRDVRIMENTPVTGWSVDADRITAVQTQQGSTSADMYLLTAGAWTSEILNSVGIEFEILPIRGQIVLLKSPQPLFTHLIEDGPRYLVPRDDGHILIGSTEEEVGFVKATTISGVTELMRFASDLVPSIRSAEVVRAWSGLRPKAKRGVPAIGPVTPFTNLYLASGHFRDGLAQSPATAQVVADLMEGKQPAIETEDFLPRTAIESQSGRLSVTQLTSALSVNQAGERK